MNKEQQRPLYEIAEEIVKCWKPVSVAAAAYLQPMRTLNSVSEMCGLDSGRLIVAYFLNRARTWKGADARRIKAELNKMIK